MISFACVRACVCFAAVFLSLSSQPPAADEQMQSDPRAGHKEGTQREERIENTIDRQPRGDEDKTGQDKTKQDVNYQGQAEARDHRRLAGPAAPSLQVAHQRISQRRNAARAHARAWWRPHHGRDTRGKAQTNGKRFQYGAQQGGFAAFASGRVRSRTCHVSKTS